MKTKINKRDIKIIAIALIGGLLLGWLFFHNGNTKTESNHLHEHSENEKETMWTCSMHPQIKQDKPGQCPICAMDLIPLTTAQSSGDDMDPNEIVLTESAAKLADIQTKVVTKGDPEKSGDSFLVCRLTAGHSRGQ